MSEIVEVWVPPERTKVYCPVCGALVADVDAEPTCRHVLFLYLDLISEFIYASPDCKRLTVEAMEAFEKSERWSDEEMELPEEDRRALPKESVDPIEYALEHLDPEQLPHVLCFSLASMSGTLTVAIDFSE